MKKKVRPRDQVIQQNFRRHCIFTRTKTDKSMYIHERIVIVASMVHETGSLAVENQ